MIFLSIAVILAIIVGMSVDSSWFNVTGSRNALVFEKKNRDYGAFIIRRDYINTIVLATGISIAVLGFGWGFPKLIALFGSAGQDDSKIKKEFNVELMKPPPLDETKPPPPPPPPPPPTVKTIAFVPPKPAPEDDKEPPPPQDQLKDQNISTETHAGDDGPPPPPPPPQNDVIDDEIHDNIALEELAEFPGGDAALLQFFQKNIKYPQIEKENGIQGKVFIAFVVEKDGSISDVKVLKGVSGGPGCDKEATRVVKMMPKWNVAKQNGKPVRVRYSVPINFRLG